MGLAPGGLMRQEIYEDDYGIKAWDTTVRSRCYVHILNSVQFLSVHWRKAAEQAANGKEIYGGRSAVVRLLRR